MPIDFKRNLAVFRDLASVEEAESLLDWLRRKPGAKVDLALCSHLHTASLQVLREGRPGGPGWPEHSELRAWPESALHPRE
jgi:hypothetical protein